MTSSVRATADTAAPETPVKSHLPVLDGVRAVAVLSVIYFHFWLGFSKEPYSLGGKLAVWGQTGVDLFFVLSGFLITGILLDSKGSGHFLRNFYARRILRIFPLYYATLVAVYFVCPVLHLNAWTPWKQSIWYWTYLQNIPLTFEPSLTSGPGHFWSLAVEEHYYLVWPFLVMLLNRSQLLKAICAAIAISLVSRIVFSHYETFYFTLARLDGLAIGSALAIFARSGADGLARVIPWAKRSLWIVGPLLIGAQLFVSGERLPAIQVVKGALIAILYACAVTLAIEKKFGATVDKLLCGRFLGSIGKYSYGMYVFHPFILSALRDAGFPYNPFSLAAGALATYAVSWLSWTVFEKRFLALKSYFEYSARADAPSR